MKTIYFTLALFALFGTTFAQDLNEINQPNFILEVVVSNLTDSSKIENAQIRVIGTDSTETLMNTDHNGKVKTSLNPNTSYAIEVNAEGYYTIKVYETTTGITSSTKFTHKFYLEKTKTCILYGPSITYDRNNFKSPKDSLIPDLDVIQSYVSLISENKQWKYLITGFSEEDESNGIAKKRAKYFRKQLINNGISKKAILINFKNNQKAIDSDVPSLQDKKQIKHNRLVLIGIIQESTP